jgi:hypothetical protein
MLRDWRILQGLTLCQAAHAWEATLVIRGLTQGQALQNPAGHEARNISQCQRAAALRKRAAVFCPAPGFWSKGIAGWRPVSLVRGAAGVWR